MRQLQQTKTFTTEEAEARQSILSALRELGLNSYAAKAFLAIVENSPVSAGSLCNITGIPDSKIYYALDELTRRKLVMLQRGTPTIYRAHDVKQIVVNMQDSANQQFAQHLNEIKKLERRLAPLANKRQDGQVELAYIVKGIRNITEKMRSLISEAKKEIVILSSNETILTSALTALRDSGKRSVAVKLATSEELHKLRGTKSVAELRSLQCVCDVIIVDAEKLLTVSHPDSEDCYAIVTQDETMVRISRDWFDNPKCTKPWKC